MVRVDQYTRYAFSTSQPSVLEEEITFVFLFLHAWQALPVLSGDAAGECDAEEERWVWAGE